MHSSLYLCLFITRRLAELFFGVWQGRRMHHRPGRRRQVARLCVPHIRGSASVNAVMIREHFLNGKAVRAPTKRPRKSSDTRTPTQIDPKRAIPREEHLRNTRYFVGGLTPGVLFQIWKGPWWTVRRARRKDLGLSHLKITATTSARRKVECHPR